MDELKEYLEKKVIDAGVTKKLGDLPLNEQKKILAEVFQRPNLASNIAGAKQGQKAEKCSEEDKLATARQMVLNDNSWRQGESRIYDENGTVLFAGSEEDAILFSDLMGYDLLSF